MTTCILPCFGCLHHCSFHASWCRCAKKAMYQSLDYVPCEARTNWQFVFCEQWQVQVANSCFLCHRYKCCCFKTRKKKRKVKRQKWRKVPQDEGHDTVPLSCPENEDDIPTFANIGFSSTRHSTTLGVPNPAYLWCFALNSGFTNLLANFYRSHIRQHYSLQIKTSRDSWTCCSAFNFKAYNLLLGLLSSTCTVT